MLQRALDVVGRWCMPLSLPVALLLFAQWPLREVLGGWSLRANDVAQALFALYVAVAVRHAGRRGAHLVACAGRPAQRASRWYHVGASLCVLPWALYLAATASPNVWRSVRGLEKFPETLNPGYFVLSLALLLLALLLVADGVSGLARALRRTD